MKQRHRWFIFIGILATLFTAGWLEHDYHCSNVAIVGAWPIRLASEKLKKAMKYHGVGSVEYNYDKHEWGFYRAGKWCSLYRSIKR